MANIKRHFIAGKMNKSVDERLVPNGEYIDALNVRLGSTEASEIGSVENSKGNTRLTTIEFGGTALSPNAKCIGVYEDGTRETIYWFINDPSFTGGSITKLDLIVSLNVNADILTYHVVSERDGTTSKTTLNFNPTYLITGIDMVEDQLFFTDDYNAPRVIDITKNYPEPSGGVDQFTAEDILVIKKPPINSPTISLSTTGGEENYIEERFLCFAYRYKYEGNQYSATSQFSEPAFTPKPFSFSTESFLNEGMVNSKNQVVITYDSGGPLVKGIDLLFKESNSNVIKVIQKLDKQEQGLADNTDYTFSFDSNKIFTILPDSELLRLFDNVPRFAQAQTIMGNRLIYGNYVDGYNLKDKNGNGLRLDYDSSLVSKEISIESLNTSLSDYTFNVDGVFYTVDAKLTIDFSNIELTSGSELSISFSLEHLGFSNTSSPTDIPTETSSFLGVSFTYVLPITFNTIHDLVTSSDFINKIGTASNIKPVYDSTNPTSCSGITFTDDYNCIITPVLDSTTTPVWTKYVSGTTSAITPTATPSSGEPIVVNSSAGSDDVDFTTLVMRRVNDIANPNDPATESAYEYFKIVSPVVTIASSPSSLSLHSNRNYEVGIIYMDDFNRATTALVSEFNSVNIPCGSAYLQNKIKVTIPPLQLAPSFATRYKFCIKPDMQGYQTIYSNIYFFDLLSSNTFFLLEGENSQKIEEGQRLIVKRDSNGFTSTCSYATVLEKKAQEEDFITVSGVTVPPGTYMKILANDFAANIGSDSFINPGTLVTVEKNSGDVPTQVYYGLSGGGPYDLTIPQGSRIKVDIRMETLGGIYGAETAIETLSLEFTSPDNYTNIIDWFDENDIEDAFFNEQVLEGPWAVKFTRFTSGFVTSDANNYSMGNNARKYVWYKNSGDDEIRFVTNGNLSYGSRKANRSTTTVSWEIIRTENTIVFETEPSDALADVWYESSESYAIDQATGYHSGNVQPQTAVQSAIIDTAFGNCYSFGNGVESYRIRDSIKGKAFDLGERFFSTSAEDYKEADRFAALTYSGVFNTETNVNKLNEFNLGILNFKNLEESFGAIQILSGRETDILTLQEDKISYVQSGKNLLSDAAGGSAVTSVPEVLGQQIARVEEYGISQNPESFVQYGYDKFFTDAKRGAVIQLRGVGRGTRGVGQGDNLTVISELGMRSWFRDLFIGKIGTQKLGAFDPYMNEYVLSSNDTELPVTEVILNCGVTRRLTVTSANPVSFTVNVGNLVGVCDIDYNILSFLDPAGSINIKEDYTPTTTNVAATGAGVINFAKDSVADEDVIITLTPVASVPGGKQVVELELTVGCPQAQEITLIEVCVSKNNQALKTIHNEYQWTDGSTFTSPLHSKQVTFPVGDRFLTTPENADYTVITAPQGGGIIPNDGDTLTVRSVKNKVDTYDFVTSPTANRLMFLRSSTLYNNTPADMTLLLAAATSLTLSNPATGIFQGDVTIPTSTDMYMYIIYDYFTS